VRTEGVVEERGGEKRMGKLGVKGRGVGKGQRREGRRKKEGEEKGVWVERKVGEERRSREREGIWEKEEGRGREKVRGWG